MRRIESGRLDVAPAVTMRMKVYSPGFVGMKRTMDVLVSTTDAGLSTAADQAKESTSSSGSEEVDPSRVASEPNGTS
ncbi:MAG TPA: hypothetical protein DIC52_12355 [Candidatus Latescibacteria bacterium]|nr:hypothetical protein [Candidatus Latescibacterota bacterium]